MNNTNTDEREFGWDDEIENDGGEFILLDTGDYDFEVEAIERARHGGSENLPPCPKAVIHIRIFTDLANKGHITLKHNLFLHTKTEGLLCQFFKSIGQRQHGERFKMDWNKVTGSIGRCKIGTRTWVDNNGKPREINQIERFYEPNGAPTKSDAKTYTPGKF